MTIRKSDPTPAVLLTDARSLIAGPDRWTQNALARNMSWHATHPFNLDAFAFSANGALIRAAYRAGIPLQDDDDPDNDVPDYTADHPVVLAFQALERSSAPVTGDPDDIVDWYNDAPGRTQDEILDWFDRAIDIADIPIRPPIPAFMLPRMPDHDGAFPTTPDERRRRRILPPLTDGTVADLRRAIDAYRVAQDACLVAKADAVDRGVRHPDHPGWVAANDALRRAHNEYVRQRDRIAMSLVGAHPGDYETGILGTYHAGIVADRAAMSLNTPPAPASDRPAHLLDGSPAPAHKREPDGAYPSGAGAINPPEFYL